jgi:predicted O-methyltransferase YrrM
LNFHFIKHFCWHYLTAKWIDVLHSPFVFNLFQKCIKKEENITAYAAIEKRRAHLLKDKRALFYEDFGASAKSRKMLVSNIASKHLKPRRIAQIIARIRQYLNSNHCVELGTSLGITTQYLALNANPNTLIHTIEASKEVRNIALEELSENASIVSHLGTFDEKLPDILQKLQSIDLLFIDGNHSYEATLRYFNLCKPYLHNDSLLIFDDIYWSKGMTNAWEEIKADPMVKVSVDLFFIGLVFFRKEQVKENFKLRIL